MLVMNQLSKSLVVPSLNRYSRHQVYYHHSFTSIPIPIHHITHHQHYRHDLLLNEAQESLCTVMKSYHDEQKPVLIRNFYNNQNENGTTTSSSARACNSIPCRAMQHWSDLNYLKSIIGEDTLVFVEIGRSYDSSNNQNQSKKNNRAEIQFGDYISYIEFFHERYGSASTEDHENENEVKDDTIIPKSDELVYMAQNDIATFSSQHSSKLSSPSLYPSIQNDYIIPKLCFDPTYQIGNGQIYNSMFWFGPKQCISPLHYDPLDNLLMQFVGRKKVVLFPKDDHDNDDKSSSTSSWHYAGANGQQYNMSPIDIMNPNLDTYPNFSKAPIAMECILHPGDILFIPYHWWHHVKSLDTAISVNVWWR